VNEKDAGGVRTLGSEVGVKKLSLTSCLRCL
jgi:hypothetical protein